MQNNLQANRNGKLVEENKNVLCYPTEARSELINGRLTRIPVAKVSAMGAAFSPLVTTLQAVSSAAGGEGLYQVSFNGVTGALAQASDGTGYLGTVMNNGIVGQARLTPVSQSVAAFNPATVFMAAAIFAMDQKLDDIKEMQKEIMDFLKQDKEAQIRTDVTNLTEILDNYRYNWANDKYVSAKLALVQDIKREAKKNIEFYEGRIKKIFDKKQLLHINQHVKDKMESLSDEFEYYRMSQHIYAFASYLEVMLLGNFEEAFLKNVTDDLSKRAYNYRVVYTDCYNQLEKYAKSALEVEVVKGVGQISKMAGGAISKIPVVSKGQADDVLIKAGRKMQRYDGNLKRVMGRFAENKDTAILTFAENIGTVSTLYNKPVRMVFDSENIYIGEAI